MISTPQHRPATRLVVRQISDILLARRRRWRTLVPQGAGVVFEIVLGASIAHLPFRDPARWIGLDNSVTIVRPVSATATAHSMGLPVSTETPLPDALRRPVALRSLSRALDMSFETLRRRVNGLIEQGLVISSDAGVIVPAQRLDELFIANNRRMQTHFDQMLNALVALEQDNVRDRHR